MSKLLEKSVQAALERYYADAGYVVKREVHTPVGYIDFILYKDLGTRQGEKILIEVKEHKGIKHAIGQVHSYIKYQSDVTESRIVYFTREGIYKPIDSSFLTEKIRFQCVHTFLPLEELYKWQIEHTHQEYTMSSKTSSKTMTSQVITSEETPYQTEMNMETLLPLTMENTSMLEKSLNELAW